VKVIPLNIAYLLTPIPLAQLIADDGFLEVGPTNTAIQETKLPY
jgi:hypothetical protein